MHGRSRAAAISTLTLVTAIVVALAVPMASLRMVSMVTACCTGAPVCHCHDQGKPAPAQAPTLRACHRTEVAVVTPELTVFQPRLPAATAPTLRAATITPFALAEPHAPPSPARPDAPS